MAPHRASFTSSLPPILDGTTFDSTSAVTHTPLGRPLRPKLLPPSHILSLSLPRSPIDPYFAEATNTRCCSSSSLDLPPPLVEDESQSSTSSSSDDEEIFASSPIELFSRSHSPTTAYISSPCASRSNSPGLVFSCKPHAPPAFLSHPPSPVVRETYVAGMHFMKPLILGVQHPIGRKERASKHTVQGNINITSSIKSRTTEPVSKMSPSNRSTTRTRSNSSPLAIPGAVGHIASQIPRTPSMASSFNNGKKATDHIRNIAATTRSVPSSPVGNRRHSQPRYSFG